MEKRRRSHDVSPKHLPDGLMTEAHSEDRSIGAELGDDRRTNTGVFGATRAWRDQNSIEVQGAYLVNRQHIVAVHDRFSSELAEILNKVVDERVVVIDHQHARHACDGSGPSRWRRRLSPPLPRRGSGPGSL